MFVYLATIIDDIKIIFIIYYFLKKNVEIYNYIIEIIK